MALPIGLMAGPCTYQILLHTVILEQRHMLTVHEQGICRRTLGLVCPHAQFPRYLGK